MLFWCFLLFFLTLCRLSLVHNNDDGSSNFYCAIYHQQGFAHHTFQDWQTKWLFFLPWSPRTWIHSQETSLHPHNTVWNHCARGQFVSLSWCPCTWICSWAKTSDCHMKGPIHSFYTLITLPGVTPVPSTIFPVAGPVTGFTFGRLLSLFALLGETTVPGDSLFSLPWYPCTWSHSLETDCSTCACELSHPLWMWDLV